MNEKPSIFKTGENCWRIDQANRAAFLVDASEYFESLVSVIDRAEKTIYIAAWDIDSRINLIRSENARDQGLYLEQFLSEKVSGTPGLHAHILCWDFASIYTLEREWLPLLKLDWKTHERVHFHLDSENPTGASHHQKIVVIDDSVAFCGGIDLTKNRWDTPKHKPNEPRRKNPDKKSYTPFHDIQMVVEGDTAETLGDLFRDRWLRATGETLSAPDRQNRRLWPKHIEPVLRDVPVATTRTFPAYKGREEIREVESLYRDMIESATQYIYIENQYLTSSAVAGALSESLKKRNGPEIVLVLPEKSSGWLEQSTMDAIRARILTRLYKDDAFNRLRVYYPASAEKHPIHVHAKVMVMDDQWARVGSSNLSNRSMGLDSECDLIAEAQNSSHSQGIVYFRNRLLAEHLDVGAADILNTFIKTGSLIKTIESMSTKDRRLQPLNPDQEFPIDGVSLIPESSFLDPEKPVMFDQVIDQFVDEEDNPSRIFHFIMAAVILALLFGLVAFWRWAPVSQWFSMKHISVLARSLAGSVYLPIGTLVAYIVGGILMFPITVLIGATAILFPPFSGSVYALTGCLINALVTYGIGMLIGKHTIRKIAGKRINRISKYLKKQGVITIAVVRNIPVAPYSIVNIVAGATRLKVKNYLFGTALGMLPGIISIMVFADRLILALQNPNWVNISIVIGVVIAVIFVFWWIKKRTTREEGVSKFQG